MIMFGAYKGIVIAALDNNLQIIETEEKYLN